MSGKFDGWRIFGRHGRVRVVVPKEEKSHERAKRTKKFCSKRAVACVLVATLSVFGVAWALSVLPLVPSQQVAPSYKGVIELFNVESWEGGCGSRSSWLTRCASKFEKTHTGLYVCVTTLTAEQFADKLNTGCDFDVVCFSRGVGCEALPYLLPLDCSQDVSDNLLRSAQIHGMQYALPLYAGCYGLFCRESVLDCDQLKTQCLTKTLTRKVGKNTFDLRPLVCGFAPFNSPLDALSHCNIDGFVQVDSNVTQYSAYEQFVANKTAVTLLGTQRDLYRLTQKQLVGKIEPIVNLPLDGYTDLVQYVGVNANSQDKSEVCQEFIQYLISSQVQQTLTDLSLFSVGGNYYSDAVYHAWQEAIEKCNVPNVFADVQSIDTQRQSVANSFAE